MDGDEQVRLGIVGNLCPSVEGDENVSFTGIYSLSPSGSVSFYLFSQFQGNVQVDGLFFGELA